MFLDVAESIVVSLLFCGVAIVQCEEPITRSEQLPCARVTEFSRTSLFFETVLANFENLLNSTNQSAKPTDLK